MLGACAARGGLTARRLAELFRNLEIKVKVGVIYTARVPNAGSVVPSTNSEDRTPDSLRSRIPWTERQKFIVAFTDSVNRMPGVVIASTDFVDWWAILSDKAFNCHVLHLDKKCMS
jgi:hypothetical protein